MTRAQRKTGLAAVLVSTVAALAILAAAPAASASPATKSKVTSKCWLQVVNDWIVHGTVTGTYPIPCYAQAIDHLNAYPDIKQYSSAIDDIHRAQLAAIHNDNGNGPGSSLGGGGNGGGGGGGGGVGTGGGGSSSSGGGTASATHKSVFKRLAADIGPGNAQSIPLPLLVLGGLAVLLLLTAAATWLTRRLQARRVTPAPAAARASGSVRPKA
ncbi:MAG TPA: hypothetical protein VFA42_00720 [Gaiellaceae bacterium]|nr:hypothetical protein [Gaiellaceae bacterium]